MARLWNHCQFHCHDRIEYLTLAFIIDNAWRLSNSQQRSEDELNKRLRRINDDSTNLVWVKLAVLDVGLSRRPTQPSVGTDAGHERLRSNVGELINVCVSAIQSDVLSCVRRRQTCALMLRKRPHKCCHPHTCRRMAPLENWRAFLNHSSRP